jgi:hypothetical protein
MTKVRTIYAIEYNPNAAVTPTDVVDGDGRVRFVAKTETHKPGAVLDIADAAVVRRLLEAGAIEILDDGWEGEIAAASEVLRTERVGPPAVASKNETWPKPRYPHNREVGIGTVIDADIDLF